MNDGQRAVIRRAMRFDLSEVLERYALDYGATLPEAEALERELKRFLILNALHPRVPYGMAGKTDDLWHTFILFTQTYAKFCTQVSGRFLHHHPGRAVVVGQQPIGVKLAYANFWRDYPCVFGEAPPDSIWPGLDTITSEPPKKRSKR